MQKNYKDYNSKELKSELDYFAGRIVRALLCKKHGGSDSVFTNKEDHAFLKLFDVYNKSDVKIHVIPTFVKENNFLLRQNTDVKAFFDYYFGMDFTRHVLEELRKGNIDFQKLAAFDENYNKIWRIDERSITTYSNTLNNIVAVNILKENAPHLAKKIIEYEQKYDGTKLFIPSDAQEFVAKYPYEASFIAKKIINNDRHGFYEDEPINKKTVLQIYHPSFYETVAKGLQNERIGRLSRGKRRKFIRLLEIQNQKQKQNEQ